MTKLLAFHGDPKIKTKYLKRVRDHARADEIIKGEYWQNGRGCAVGCTIHSDRHVVYETELGIPQMLARFEDCVFEGASKGYAKTWPERFLKSCKTGTDLSKVGWKFQYYLLLDPKYGTVNLARREDRELFLTIGGLIWDLSLGKSIDRSAAEAAVSGTESARLAARSARLAARSVAAAVSGTESAVPGTEAAWSAWSEGESAAESARLAAWFAGEAAWSAAAYERQGDKLLELIKEAGKGL